MKPCRGQDAFLLSFREMDGLMLSLLDTGGDATVSCARPPLDVTYPVKKKDSSPSVTFLRRLGGSAGVAAGHLTQFFVLFQTDEVVVETECVLVDLDGLLGSLGGIVGVLLGWSALDLARIACLALQRKS